MLVPSPSSLQLPASGPPPRAVEPGRGGSSPPQFLLASFWGIPVVAPGAGHAGFILIVAPGPGNKGLTSGGLWAARTLLSLPKAASRPCGSDGEAVAPPCPQLCSPFSPSLGCRQLGPGGSSSARLGPPCWQHSRGRTGPPFGTGEGWACASSQLGTQPCSLPPVWQSCSSTPIYPLGGVGGGQTFPCAHRPPAHVLPGAGGLAVLLLLTVPFRPQLGAAPCQAGACSATRGLPHPGAPCPGAAGSNLS